MRISEKQLVILLDLAKFLCTIDLKGFGQPYTRDYVISLVNEINKQQSDELFDVK